MKTLILLSGGLDSSTLAYHLMADGQRLTGISVHYGQRHRRELEAARKIASHLGIPHHEITMEGLAPLLKGSSLTDPTLSTPHGHYNAPAMKQTVVPGRNALMLAAGWAIACANGMDHVAAAVHGGDHHIYPDCRGDFLEALNGALTLGTREVGSAVSLLTPFLHWTKADIAWRAAALGVPFELTWTCYEGAELHCGRCGACGERILAMAEHGIEDPTPYADTTFALSLEAAT